jgi:group I intron endonuclease
MIGIYIIKNKDNGKVYVGQSKDLSHRKACHFYDLRENRHKNIELQKAYNDNPNALEFKIVCSCEEEDLDYMEKFYIKKYKSNIEGYNKTDGGFKGAKMSESTKKKMSKAQMGNKYMVGIKLSDEWKKHLSEAQPHKRKIECIETGIIYDSFADASRKTGLNRTKIVSVCTGKRKTTGGYHFRYANERTSN